MPLCLCSSSSQGRPLLFLGHVVLMSCAFTPLMTAGVGSASPGMGLVSFASIAQCFVVAADSPWPDVVVMGRRGMIAHIRLHLHVRRGGSQTWSHLPSAHDLGHAVHVSP